MMAIFSKLLSGRGVLAVVLLLLGSNGTTWLLLKAAKADLRSERAQCIAEAEATAAEASQQAAALVAAAQQKAQERINEMARRANKARMDAERDARLARAETRRLQNEIRKLETESPDVRAWGSTRLPDDIIGLLRNAAEDHNSNQDR